MKVAVLLAFMLWRQNNSGRLGARSVAILAISGIRGSIIPSMAPALVWTGNPCGYRADGCRWT